MPNLPREHSSAKTRILISVTSPLSCNFYNGVLGIYAALALSRLCCLLQATNSVPQPTA